MYKIDRLEIIIQLNKKTEFNGGSRGNNKQIDEKTIKDSLKWCITKYSVFVR
jgi:hypothetical protein